MYPNLSSVNLIEPEKYNHYLFKFTIPATISHRLDAIIAYTRVTNNILRYIEKRVNTHFVELQSNSLDKYIGVVIENAIYDMFIELENIDYESQPNLNYDDIDDYVLRNGDYFRHELYVFTKSVINNCVFELSKIRAVTTATGRPIETYTLTRSKTDPQTLEVHGYLDKII